MRPFEGIRVLDFSKVVSGPYCTQLLGLLGAEIIKIENRDGGDITRQGMGDPVLKDDGLAATFIMFNVGKKSLTLDLKKPEANAIIMKLVRLCDVIVENYRSGVMKTLGLGYEKLNEANPRIVYCSISGFGQTGPDSQAPAFDGNIQALSGMMAITGDPDGPPMRAGYSVADTSAGLQAALSIAAALYQRDQTNQGQYIDVAMLDAAVSLLSQTAGAWLNGGIVQRRRANLGVNREPITDTFKTADGVLMLSVMRDNHFAILARVLGMQYLADDPRCATREMRVAHTEFIKNLVQAELLKAGTDEWKCKFDEAGIPCSPVLELADALSQPQIKHRGLVVDMVDEKTSKVMRSFNMPFKYAHDSPSPSFPPQRLGSQNEEVLLELGYSMEEIEDLTRREVI